MTSQVAVPDTVVKPKGYTENPDLLPVPPSEKKYNTLTFTFMMFSMNTCIPMFFLGPIAHSLGLNLWQALVGALIGNLAAVTIMYLNGVVGVKYGIPFPVQLREPFGFKGAQIPVILRGLAGLMWFGIEAYAGSLALVMIALYLAGVPADQLTDKAIRLIPFALIFYLGSFIFVMRHGLKGIGRMADIAGPILLLYFIWLVYFLATQPQFAENIPKIYKGTAGWLSLGFLTYLAVQTNWWATVALNISDLTRGLKSTKALLVGLLVGIVLCQIVGTALGFYLVVMTGEVLPQTIIAKFAPGIGAVIIGLLFAFLAPWSTDITANAPPLIDILMSVFKLRWKMAVVIAAIIVFFAAPWWAVESGPAYVDYITQWAANYGILLGPIVGPMVGNYWIVRKKKYNLQRLYTYGEGGPWYKNGWSLAGFASLITTILLSYVVAALTNQMAYVGGFPFPGGIIWYFDVVVSLVLYLVFAKIFKEW
jgi:NCS1 family nucleobase:cation symporter-1